MSRALAIVVPVYNEESALNAFLAELSRYLLQNLNADLGDSFRFGAVSVVVVDDGSKKKVRIKLPPERPDGLRVFGLRHVTNLGQGAALRTGIEYARDSLDADIFATMDSDGQHQPQDLRTLLQKLEADQADIVFGNRFRGDSNVPLFRRVVLKMALSFERWLTGLSLSDSHNGYRVFNRRCAETLQIRQNRMAHATEFKQIVAREKLRYAEVPVDIRYTQDTRKKGQSNLGAVVILRDLIHSLFFGRLG